MALGGQVQVYHGGVEAAVAEVLLNPSDVDAGLEQVGGIIRRTKKYGPLI